MLKIAAANGNMVVFKTFNTHLTATGIQLLADVIDGNPDLYDFKLDGVENEFEELQPLVNAMKRNISVGIFDLPDYSGYFSGVRRRGLRRCCLPVFLLSRELQMAFGCGSLVAEQICDELYPMCKKNVSGYVYQTSRLEKYAAVMMGVWERRPGATRKWNNFSEWVEQLRATIAQMQRDAEEDNAIMAGYFKWQKRPASAPAAPEKEKDEFGVRLMEFD